MFRYLRLLAGLSFMLAIAVAPATASTSLTIGVTQFPSTLHPNIDSMLAKSYVLGMVQRPLTAFNHDWQLVCWLCTELPSLENGRAVLETTASGDQGIAVRYTLRDDAQWGDGIPVTTADVEFTYQVGRTEAAGISNQEMYRRILSIDIIDDRSFTLHMDRVTFDYAAINDFRLVPAHLEKSIFERNPAEYRSNTLYLSDPTLPGLYFGPYRISELLSGSYIVLVKNPTWWGQVPAFDRIVIKTIENTAALEANLLSGEVDMIAGELGLSLDQAVAFEQRHGDEYTVSYHPGLFYEHIDLQLENPFLQDRRVRQALLYGIDRAAISQELFSAKQPVADTSVSPMDWVYATDVPRYRYDPQRAAQLLDEAGWSLNQGTRYNDAGDKLSFELMTTAGNRSRELIEQVLQSQWQALGVEIKIRNQPPRVYFGETLRKREHKAMAMFAWIASPENVPVTILHSRSIPTEANGWSGQNTTGYNNPRMDTLLDQIELELDREARRGLWAELQVLYATDLPVLPLFFNANAHIWPTWLRGVRPTGHLNQSTLWIEQWHRIE